MRFQTPDPEIEDAYNESPYSMCDNNMVIRTDPDGRFWWAVAGAALDYGFQVYDNYKTSGKFGYNELVGNVNFLSVGLSTISPTGKLAIVKTLAVETLRASVQITANEGFKGNTDIKDITKKAVLNTAVSASASKLTNASSNKALREADKDMVKANNRVSTAERRLEKSPASSVKTKKLSNANLSAQQARQNQVRTKMLNSTIGKINKNALQQAANTTNERLQKKNENQ